MLGGRGKWGPVPYFHSLLYPLKKQTKKNLINRIYETLISAYGAHSTFRFRTSKDGVILDLYRPVNREVLSARNPIEQMTSTSSTLYSLYMSFRD